MEICPHFGLCGGCTYQDMSYEEQLALKYGKVCSLLAEYAQDDVWEAPVESPRRYGYRNKMEFSFGDCEKGGPLTLGLHQKKSFYNVITVNGCNIVDDDFRRILSATLDFFSERGVTYYHKRRQDGVLRHLVIRKAARTGEILVLLAATSGADRDMLAEWVESLQKLEYDGTIAGILYARNDLPADTVQSQETVVLFGRDHFYEEILGLRFRISPFSFFQTNSLGAEKLYETVREYCGDVSGLRIFDLYSGTGTIAQMLAAVASEVTGVEIVEEAVDAARENAKLNSLSNCSFIAGDVFKVLSEAGASMGLPDMMVLDPPREGMTPKALERILSYEVPRLVYVSCKPESLARDMETFAAHGYRIERARCVDMFPWTRHVETVVLLSKGNISSEKIRVEFNLEDMDMSKFQQGATYEQIQDWVQEKYGFHVTHLNIAKTKRKCGIIERQNYNLPKREDSRSPETPKEKEEAIIEAFKVFQMIQALDKQD